jgi:hypothetical protein
MIQQTTVYNTQLYNDMKCMQYKIGWRRAGAGGWGEFEKCGHIAMRAHSALLGVFLARCHSFRRPCRSQKQLAFSPPDLLPAAAGCSPPSLSLKMRLSYHNKSLLYCMRTD